MDPVSRALSGDRHEGRTIEVRVGDAGGEIRRTGPEGGEAHTRTTRQPPVRVGHEGRALLVTRRDEADGGVDQGIDDVQDLLAGDAEHVLDALVLEATDDE